jgi:hypothetical protein
MTSAEVSARRSACHEMLLRLAGWLPDELMTRCRDQVAQGAFGELARAVTFSVLSANLTLASADAETLADLLAETGGDKSALAQVRIDDFDQPTWFFAASPAGDGPGPDGGQPQEARHAADELIEAVAGALSAEPGTIGAWLAWRLASDGEPLPPPKPIFLVEVGDTADAATTAARTQHRLAAAGQASPQVEVFHTGDELPAYQQMARAYGELAWAAEADPGMQIAPIFDDVDPDTGPVFSPDHPRLDDDEAGRVAEYLRRGEAVLVTTAQMDDVVDTARQYCVPMNFRTDGLWIWTEALAYYAGEHQLEPDPELLAHIRAGGYTVPAVDGVGLHRALALLQEPADSEPVWTFGSSQDEPGYQAGGYDDEDAYGEDEDADEDEDEDDEGAEGVDEHEHGQLPAADAPSG